jgi:hypothetical protein
VRPVQGARGLPALLAPVAVVLFVATLGGGAGAAAGDVAGPPAQLVTADDARDLPPLQARTAEWCGTTAQSDRVPNALAGYPVHWLYVIPADGEDRTGTIAGLMQGDAEAIDAWWRREDPARTLRNDVAPFPCGLQLDLSTLRLSQSSGQIPTSARFSVIFDSLRAAGFGSDFTKYVVYYDGPAADARICGQGGSLRSGTGLAVIYLRACPGVSTAAVTAHELLHTFGAVPSAAPNACDGHVCDNVLDLMYPSIDTSPLESRFLDPGRDDYYGHGRSWLDTRNAPWLVQLDQQVPLSLAIAGPGTVAADVPGLECAQPCTTTWNSGTQLQLRATPAGGAKLVRWGGSCLGSAACAVVVGQAGQVSALFAPAAYRLAVTVVGQGTVTSGRPGIACRPRCAASFPSYVPLRLTAKPAKGWRLRAWTGACRGSRPACSVSMTSAATTRATFVRTGR